MRMKSGWLVTVLLMVWPVIGFAQTSPALAGSSFRVHRRAHGTAGPAAEAAV